MTQPNPNEPITGAQGWPTRISRFLVLISLLLGTLALAGWVFDFPSLRKLLPSGSEMKPNTAICLILLGTALFIHDARGISRTIRLISNCLAIVSILIAGLTVLEYWLARNFGLDEFLFRDVSNPIGTSHAGRMSQPTAWMFLLGATGILCLDRRLRHGVIPTQWLALAMAFIPMDILLCYVYGNMNVLAFGAYRSYMAVPTAIALLSLAVALLLHSPAVGIVRPLTAKTQASARFRILLLALIIVPPVLGWFVLTPLGGNLHPAAFGVSNTVMLCVAVLAGLAWLNALGLNESEFALLQQTGRLETLNRLGTMLAAEMDLQKIVQAATDAGRELSGAAFGAFFYNVKNEQGESYTLYTLSGAPREAFEKFPLPRNTALFGPTFRGEGIVRIADVALDPRYGKSAPYHGMPPGHLPVRSYLAVPVYSRTGAVIGGLFFGHAEPNIFTMDSEKLVLVIASEAAIAIDNSNLYSTLQLDVERHKDAELASRRLAAIVESSDDAIISKDLNGIIMSWNQAAERLFGYLAGEVIGRPITIIIPQDRQSEEPVVLARIRNGERIQNYETIRRRKDGTLLNVSLTVSPIFSADDKIIGASKIARDITERKRGEELLLQTREQLARANEDLEQRVRQRTASLEEAVAQMEEFSYSVSHDLRAPVRAMHGYAEAVLEDYGDRLDERGREFLKNITRSGIRMSRLVSDILTYSRIARSKVTLLPVSLDTLVRDIISHYPEMQGPDVKIVFEGELPKVMAHEPSLSQALSNLLNNAVKFVAPGVKPFITIGSERRGDQVRLWVQDNGIGIKAEHQGRLFGLFERIHNDKRYEGTGIGLAIVRKAIERMGGKAGMESNGTGSKFWIELLAAAKEP